MTPQFKVFLMVLVGVVFFLLCTGCTEMTAEEKFLQEQARVEEIRACKRDMQCVLICNRLPTGHKNDLRDCRPSIGGLR